MGPIILLILLGIILILAEVFLIPGFAVTGILGIGALAGSCYFGFVEYGSTGGIITIIVNIALITTLLIITLKSKTWKRFSLETKINAKVDSQPKDKGICEGMEGVAITRLNPMGKAKIGEEFVEVRSTDGIIDPKTPIQVAYLEQEKIFVSLKK